MKKLIALALVRFGGSNVSGLHWPNENVNEVLVSLVNQKLHRSVVEIVKASSDQGKSIAGRVDHRGRKIELAVKPRFDGVLVRGNHIHEMVRHERSNMTCNQLGREVHVPHLVAAVAVLSSIQSARPRWRRPRAQPVQGVSKGTTGEYVAFWAPVAEFLARQGAGTRRSISRKED